MAEVELWLHPDIFLYGVIHAHPKLTISYLKKVLTYAKAKEDGFPDLSWSIWKHMAVNKMLMTEDLAWTYFQLYFTLKNKTVKEQIDFAELRQQLLESKHFVSYKQKMKIPTAEFVLFLFLQQANKVSLRKSLLGEEWPGTSPRLSDSSRSDTSPIITDEHKHIQFFGSNFAKLIDLLFDKSKQNGNHTISCKMVQILGSVVLGKFTHEKTILSLLDLATHPKIQSISGYEPSKKYFSFHKFENWLLSCLTENPFGLSYCLNFGKRLNWTSEPSTLDLQRNKAKILTNALLAPLDQKLFVFTQCSNQTIARQTNLLDGSRVKIHRCHSSYLYLLSPLKLVSVENCSNTLIVLGPVSTGVKLHNCQNLILICPCQSVIVSSCSNITLHITTPTQPIIISEHNVSSSDVSVVLAPFNTFYGDLENHLALVGLAVSPNTDEWNNPVCIGNRTDVSSYRSGDSQRFPLNNDMVSAKTAFESKRIRLMDPKDFYIFSIPFKTFAVENKKSGKVCATEEIPGGLPKDYAEAVTAKQRATERWRQAVKKSNMTKEDRLQFQKLVEEKFKDWVSDTNNQRQLDDLGHKKFKST